MRADQVSSWLSDHRFKPFLDAKASDLTSAVALYEWHAEMASSSMRTIHHFEVMVRNAVDGRLGAGQPDSPIEQTWLLDPAVVKPEGRQQVQIVLDRLRRERYARERRRVVAGLSFSFWKNLLASRYEPVWVRSLRHAFPGAALRRDVEKPLGRVHLWRNRIAHHDSLLNQRNDYRYVDMVQVATFISVDAADFLKRNSDMLTVLAQKP
jgi:hypothetical protein